jgi:hypothetical protein
VVHDVMHRLGNGRDEGAVAIVVALFAIVLFGFAALVVDVGNGQNVRTQSQNAVDSAALAGVRALAQGDDVVSAVQQYVGYSFQGVDWSNCNDPDHLAQTDNADATDQCISWESSSPDPNGQVAYQVRVKFPPKRVPESFAGVFGGGSITVSPIAVAASGTTILPPCVPCDPPIGADLQPSGTPSPSPSPVFSSPAPTTSPAAPPPPPTPATACPTPGTYVAGADFDIASSCVLGAGLYVFDNSNLSIAGSLSTSHATLVFEGTATMTVGGASMLVATGQSDTPVSDEIPGVAVLFDSGDTATFQLGSHFQIVGNVYALDATWETNGGDCLADGDCIVENGALSVAHTNFANSVVPLVGNGQPPPSPAPAHLSQ